MTLNEFMKKYNLVKLNGLESENIFVNVKYATMDNFTGQQVYPDDTCLLRSEAVEDLIKAAHRLKGYGYGLVVYDAFRPQSVQEFFWKILPNPDYIADPKIGSAHTKGNKVDVNLGVLDPNVAKGYSLAIMPCGYDCFSTMAHVENARKNNYGASNLSILLDNMEDNNFKVNPKEWWDYEHSKDYPLILEDYERKENSNVLTFRK